MEKVFDLHEHVGFVDQTPLVHVYLSPTFESKAKPGLHANTTEPEIR